MATTITVHEAEAHFPQLFRRVLKGEAIIIAVDGEPVALLAPLPPLVVSRVPGKDAGRVIVLQEFSEPLPEFDTQ